MLKELGIALKMQQCYNSVKGLYGDGFTKAMSEYKDIIKGAMIKHKLTSALEATMQVIKEAKNEYGSDMFTLKMLAACFDLIENDKYGK